MITRLIASIVFTGICGFAAASQKKEFPKDCPTGSLWDGNRCVTICPEPWVWNDGKCRSKLDKKRIGYWKSDHGDEWYFPGTTLFQNEAAAVCNRGLKGSVLANAAELAELENDLDSVKQAVPKLFDHYFLVHLRDSEKYCEEVTIYFRSSGYKKSSQTLYEDCTKAGAKYSYAFACILKKG